MISKRIIIRCMAAMVCCMYSPVWCASVYETGWDTGWENWSWLASAQTVEWVSGGGNPGGALMFYAASSYGVPGTIIASNGTFADGVEAADRVTDRTVRVSFDVKASNALYAGEFYCSVYFYGLGGLGDWEEILPGRITATTEWQRFSTHVTLDPSSFWWGCYYRVYCDRPVGDGVVGHDTNFFVDNFEVEVIAVPGSTDVAIVNPSFENPVLSEGQVAYFNTPGWSAEGSGVLGISHEIPWHNAGRDGANTLFGYGGGGDGVTPHWGLGNSQNLGVNFIAGEEYVLTAKVCRPGQYYSWNVPHDSLAKIALAYAGTEEEVAARVERIYINPAGHPAWGTMQDYSLVYTAWPEDEAYEIQVRLMHGDNDGVYFDDVRLSHAEVPPTDCAGALAAGYWQPGDLNEDCVVDLEDFSILANHWLGTILWVDPDQDDCCYLIGIL